MTGTSLVKSTAPFPAPQVRLIPDLVAEINDAHDAFVASGRSMLEHAKRCGDRLLKVKGVLPHGSFGPWIARHCWFSWDTANAYMRCAKRLANSEHAQNFEPKSIRALLRSGRDQSVHYASDTPEWSTPPDLFAVLDAEFGFTLDVCATAENAKCAQFFTAQDDGLAQVWGGVCWMNPPYGGVIKDWVTKARAESQRGATVVSLVPARTDTSWWWDNCRYGEIRLLRGRLHFGGGDTSAPFPSAVIVFPRPPIVLHWEWQSVAEAA